MQEGLSGQKDQAVVQIRAALDYLPNDRAVAAELEPWLRWQIDNYLDTITHEDVTTSDLIILAAVLGPIFARTLGRQPPSTQWPPLRAV